jgi:acyl-coenzyme A synthetase/AMP-(fatty) acid ligase
LNVSNDQVVAYGGHVEQLTPMCDVIEITSEEEFLLHGRTADLVNVAGKRSSFGYLNAQLNAIPGVIDGAFFLREEMTGSTGVVRLGAVVVAPELTAAALTEQLRQLSCRAMRPASCRNRRWKNSPTSNCGAANRNENAKQTRHCRRPPVVCRSFPRFSGAAGRPTAG